jgi:hypothetical protein
MKRNHRAAVAAAPPKREIRVRMTAARAAGLGTPPPDVWVVNGRVIRFLDPMRPDDNAKTRKRHGGLVRLLLWAVRPTRDRRAR